MLRVVYIFCVFLALLVSPLNLFAQIAAELFEALYNAKNSEQKCAATRTIAKAYHASGSYSKAIEYYNKALVCTGGEAQNKNIQDEIYEALASSHLSLGQPDQAIVFYQEMEQTANGHDKFIVYRKIAALYQKQKKTAQALEYNLKMQNIVNSSTPVNELLELYNNIGYLYREQGNEAKSNEYFIKVQEISKNNKTLSPASRIAMLLNIGVSYTSSKQYRAALVSYQDALKIAQTSNDNASQANVYNYIAVNYYLNNDNRMAIINANKALEKANLAGDDNIAINSYQLLYDINQREGNLPDAQRYYQQAQSLKEKIEKKENAAQKALLAKQVEAERKENEIQNMIADRELQAVQLKQSELERNKQEQELLIKRNEVERLKQEQELQSTKLSAQKAEQQRIQQLLEITKQKAIADEQQRIIENQNLLAQKEKAENQRLLSEKESEKNARLASEIASKKENELRQQELEQTRFRNTITTVVLILVALLLGLVVYILWKTYKANKQLKKQQAQIHEQNNALKHQANEILIQNTELQIKQEEILSQREAISLKNQELEDKGKIITASINAALHIQQSISPRPKEIAMLFEESFILSKPRDVVSGDFFWLGQVQTHTIAAAIDCTGHAVEGAFMTIIGKNLLDQLVISEQITEPQMILSALHGGIKRVLRQNETGNNSGMDVGVVRLTQLPNNTTECIFGGARNSMYYILPDQARCQVLKGTRKSLGGKQNEDKKFTQTAHHFPKNTLIYLETDGLADQNNANRERFGEARILKLLEENARKPLLAQKKALENTLAEYTAGVPQRDDILLIGLKI